MRRWIVMAHAPARGSRPGVTTITVLLAGLLLSACAKSNLRRAVKYGDIHEIREQIERAGMSPELRNNCGWTLLHYASYYQRPPVVKYLLSRSVNINATTREHSQFCINYSRIPAGSTALIIAAYYGQADIVTLLLERGANRRIKNAEGYDALTYARKYEFAETVRALQGRLGE